MNLFHYLDPVFLITTFGLVGIFAIVFAESGLFFGFFLPGDSLLFTAGLLASQGYFDIWLLWAGCTLCAIVGDSVGYAFGARVGMRLFRRPDSRFFKQEYLRKTEAFYARYGTKTIIFARFIPIIRTFAPILAGVARMSYRTFLTYNIVGGVVWVSLFLGLSYTLGAIVPGIERYLLPIILFIIVLSFIPALPHLLRMRKPDVSNPAHTEGGEDEV